MRYQTIWLSLRNVTMPSSRIFDKCWDNADCVDKRAHGCFAVFHQLAENHQAPLVRKRA